MRVLPGMEAERREVMTERTSCVPRLSLGPDALKRAGDAFDQSWNAIAANFNAADAETARAQLATLILGLSADGSRDAEQLKAAALEFVSCGPSPADLMH
jgi:hypothetical protein